MKGLSLKEKTDLIKEGEFSKVIKIWVNTDFSYNSNCSEKHRKW